MKSKVCVYTCITGGYDSLREIEIRADNVDFICFTNDKNLKSKTWKVVHVENGGLTNHQLSRKLKMVGHPLIDKKYEISIWMDASVLWLQNPSDFAAKYLKKGVFACFKHWARDNVQDEAKACLSLHKDSKASLLDGLNFLKKEGFPDNLGLTEMTVFIKRHNDRKVREAMALWYDTYKNHSKRDQLSFMYAVWKTGLKIELIEEYSVWQNPYFNWKTHTMKQDVGCGFVYFGKDPIYPDFSNFFEFDYTNKDNKFNGIFNIPRDCDGFWLCLTDAAGIKITDLVLSKGSIEKLTGGLLWNDVYIPNVGRNYQWVSGQFRAGDKVQVGFVTDLNVAGAFFEAFNSMTKRLEDSQSEKRRLMEVNFGLENELAAIKSSRAWKLVTKLRRK